MKEMVAVLVDIRSVWNVGSIFRTADAVGIKKIYLCGITPAPLDRFGNPRNDFAKVSLGAERSVSWEKTVSPTPLIKVLRAGGYKIFAVEQHKHSLPYYEVKTGVRQKAALVVGNEVKGLSTSIVKRADAILEIPMRGKKESLNVSVAFGIAAYRLRYPG